MAIQYIKGIDVSKYNGEVKWDQVKASGIEFSGIRLLDTDGVAPDPMFKKNWIESKQAGVLRFWYAPHYAWLDQVSVADTIFKTLDEFDRGDWNFGMGELPPAVDQEQSQVFNSSDFMWAQMVLLIEEIKKRCLAKPILYTSAYYFDSYINKNRKYKFNDSPDLWVSNYVFDYQKIGKRVTTWENLDPYISTFKPALPSLWQEAGYKIWQLAGDDGMINGIDTACDMNIWHGTYAELVKWGQDHRIKENDLPQEESRYEKVSRLFREGKISKAIYAITNWKG